MDELKYGQPPARDGQGANATELLTVKLRYKEPDGDASKPLNVGVPDRQASFMNASENFKFAAAVAEFGMLCATRATGSVLIPPCFGAARASTGGRLRGYRTDFVASSNARTISALDGRRPLPLGGAAPRQR